MSAIKKGRELDTVLGSITLTFPTVAFQRQQLFKALRPSAKRGSNQSANYHQNGGVRNSCAPLQCWLMLQLGSAPALPPPAGSDSHPQLNQETSVGGGKARSGLSAALQTEIFWASVQLHISQQLHFPQKGPKESYQSRREHTPCHKQ